MFNNLNCNSDKLPQPKAITISLKEHQKTAFTAMSTIEEKGFINHKDLIVETNLGILADIPGSGKSMMVISLISNKKIAPFHNRVHYGSPFVCLKDSNQEHFIPTNLILVPNKLVLQWKKY
jgi:SNF2 family DNA or RNA helicase